MTSSGRSNGVWLTCVTIASAEEYRDGDRWALV